MRKRVLEIMDKDGFVKFPGVPLLRNKEAS